MRACFDRRRTGSLLPLLGVCVALGCGAGGPRPIPVRGVVTYKGAPLTSGSVTFSPVDAAKGRPATAGIEANGRFAPSTLQKGDGLMVGDYHVCVVAYKPAPPDIEPQKMKDGLAIPQKYTDITTSGLTIKVTEADSGKEYKLELQD